jgi:hypothetical protein
MKRLGVALVLVLMTSGAALAHGRFGFGVSVGFPLFYPYYGYPYYSYPYYGYPYSYGYPAYSYPESYTVYEEPQAYQGRKPGKVIENYYVNGRLVERRIKVYDDRQGNGSSGEYDQ